MATNAAFNGRLSGRRRRRRKTTSIYIFKAMFRRLSDLSPALVFTMLAYVLSRSFCQVLPEVTRLTTASVLRTFTTSIPKCGETPNNGKHTEKQYFLLCNSNHYIPTTIHVCLSFCLSGDLFFYCLLFLNYISAFLFGKVLRPKTAAHLLNFHNGL